MAPIIVFAYDRPDHLNKTLAALAKNDLAPQSVLYVYCDGAREWACEAPQPPEGGGNYITKRYGVMYCSRGEYDAYLQRNFPNAIPFYAHTYGKAQKGNDAILYEYGLTPVYVLGNSNYNDALHIDRELVSNERLLKGLL